MTKIVSLWNILLGLLILTISADARQINKNTFAVKDFGAAGNGRTDDSRAIAEAFRTAASQNGTVVFESGKTYAIDTIALTGTRSNVYQRLTIIGNGARLKSFSRGTGNLLTFYYTDTLSISGLTLIGNKQQEKNGHGIGVYYSKNCTITNCDISNCKYSGILIAWVVNGTISGNRIYNNGDATLPSDGIGIHSMEGGTISCNIIYNNNPNGNDDGDGIQIGATATGITGYYNQTALKPILVKHNICYKHGRRGIKVQRSNVTVTENFLSDNTAAGVSLVRGDFPISSIVVKSNVIQKSYIGVNTDGGGNLRIKDASIQDNDILESIVTDKIQLKDAQNLKISGNNFFRTKAQKYGKNNSYFDVNAAATVSDVNLNQDNVADFKVNDGKMFQRSALPASEKISDETGENHFIAINGNTNVFTVDANKVGKDYFFVYSNYNASKATINILNGKSRKSIALNSGHQLILYTCNGKLNSYVY